MTLPQDTIFRHPEATQVRRLTSAAGLPTDDLDALDPANFWAAGPRTAPAGVVGLERCGTAALLRSLAVDDAWRGRGVGRALVEAAERAARAEGVQTLCLLTTTAAAFFERLGYRPAERDTAPEAIRATREFRDLCPASAVFMVKHLTDDASA